MLEYIAEVFFERLTKIIIGTLQFVLETFGEFIIGDLLLANLEKIVVGLFNSDRNSEEDLDDEKELDSQFSNNLEDKKNK